MRRRVGVEEAASGRPDAVTRPFLTSVESPGPLFPASAESPGSGLRALIAFVKTALPGSRPMPEHNLGSDQPGNAERPTWSACLPKEPHPHA